MPEINNSSNIQISSQTEVISSNIKTTAQHNAPLAMKIKYSKSDKDPFIYVRVKGKQIKGS